MTANRLSLCELQPDSLCRSLDSGRQHSQSVPSMPVANNAAQHQPICEHPVALCAFHSHDTFPPFTPAIGQRVIAKSLSFNADSAPLEGLADFSPPPQSRERGLSGKCCNLWPHAVASSCSQVPASLRLVKIRTLHLALP